MAENISIFKIKGKLGGLSFYNMLRKKNLVKQSSGHSRERLKNDPAFANTRKTNVEFGGGSRMGASLRRSWGYISKEFQDSYMASRLTKVSLKVITHGEGHWGEREGDLRTHGKHLIGFPLDEEQPLSHCFGGEFQTAFNAERTQCVITCDTLLPENLTKKPEQATHVKFTAVLSLISNYHWNERAAAYRPLIPEQHALGNIQETGYLPIHPLPTHWELVVDTPKHIIPHANVACVVSLGISYGKQRSIEIDRLITGQAMKIVEVV